MTDLVPVRVPCPSGQHPDGDSVSLKPTIGLAGGYEARRKIGELIDGATNDEVTGLLLDVYVRHGVAEWTLHDDEGKELPLTRENVRTRLLDDLDAGLVIGNAADDLYTPAVVLPLAKRVKESLPGTPAEISTSAKTGSSPSPRKRSTPSSTSTIQTDATETTSA